MDRRPTHPQSPVQPGGDRWWLPLLVAGFAAVLWWAVSQHGPRKTPDQPKTSRGPANLPHSAKANLVELFSNDDYPQAAIRHEEQGTVAYQLSIGSDGRVDRCAIEASSGSATLDNQTCNILKERARFEPARDQRGNAVRDSFSGRIKWVLPDE